MSSADIDDDEEPQKPQLEQRIRKLSSAVLPNTENPETTVKEEDVKVDFDGSKSKSQVSEISEVKFCRVSQVLTTRTNKIDCKYHGPLLNVIQNN